MLVQLLGVDVKVDSNGFVSVRFNLDKWEEYIAGKFTGENAEQKGWLELAKEKPSDGAIMIQVNKYPKSAKAGYSADQIKQMIKVWVFIQLFSLSTGESPTGEFSLEKAIWHRRVTNFKTGYNVATT